MSRDILLNAVNLRPNARPAHAEYSLGYHTDYIRRITGCDPATPAGRRALADRWVLDFNWSSNDGLHGDWGKRGRATDMGHAEYAADGSDRRDLKPCPFDDPEQVWAFDAVVEYGLPDFDEQVRAYEAQVRRSREDQPQVVTSGGYYKTIVSGGIESFGWDMLLVACAEPERMEPVFDSFFRRTLFHMQAWARTSAEVIIQHDDFVWTQGPFMNPAYYRSVIIPRYAELWKPLHAAGKKVLFCSDGDFTEFVDDIAAAGADGLIFEPCMDFGRMVERLGSSHCLVGSAVDCRDLTLGHRQAVVAAVDRTMALLPKCKGLVWAVGNHLPANIPEEMMDLYIGLLRDRWGVAAGK